jgi:hypothetical protein
VVTLEEGVDWGKKERKGKREERRGGVGGRVVDGWKDGRELGGFARIGAKPSLPSLSASPPKPP